MASPYDHHGLPNRRIYQSSALDLIRLFGGVPAALEIVTVSDLDINHCGRFHETDGQFVYTGVYTIMYHDAPEDPRALDLPPLALDIEYKVTAPQGYNGMCLLEWGGRETDSCAEKL